MPLTHILKNKLQLQKHFHLQEWAIDNWPFWMLEENVKLVNEIIDEEEKQQKNGEQEHSKSMPDYGGMMKNASSFGNNFQMPSF